MKMTAVMFIAVLCGIIIAENSALGSAEYSGGSKEEAEKIFGEVAVGRLVTEGKYPVSSLAVYLYENGKFYMPVKIFDLDLTDIANSVKKDSKTCFAVDQLDYKSCFWRSIHVFGKLKLIEEKNEREGIRGKFDKLFGVNPDDSIKIIAVEPEYITIGGAPMSSHRGPVPNHKIPVLKLDKNGEIIAGTKKIGNSADSSATKDLKDVLFPCLPASDSVKILKKAIFGRLNTLGSEPYSVPITYGYADGKIYMHSSGSGLKADNVRENKNVSFTVDWFDNGGYLESVEFIGKADIPEDIKEAGLGFKKISKFFWDEKGEVPEDLKLNEQELSRYKMILQNAVIICIKPEKIIAKKFKIPGKLAGKLPGVLILEK